MPCFWAVTIPLRWRCSRPRRFKLRPGRAAGRHPLRCPPDTGPTTSASHPATAPGRTKPSSRASSAPRTRCRSASAPAACARPANTATGAASSTPPARSARQRRRRPGRHPAQHPRAHRQPPLLPTLDIDCLDPAFAPGTGTPEPGGLTSSQVLTLLEGLAPLNFVGMDCVEVAPAYDHAELTTNAAATFAGLTWPGRRPNTCLPCPHPCWRMPTANACPRTDIHHDRSLAPPAGPPAGC